MSDAGKVGSGLKVGTRAQWRVVAAMVIACLLVALVAAPASSAAPTRGRGYWIAGQNTQVFAYGDAQTFTKSDARAVRGQIVDMAARPTGRGYWLLGQDGGVYPYGDARDLGQGAFRDQSAAAIGATPSGDGYFLASEQGEVQSFGDAVARGSLDKKDLKKRIVDLAVTPSGNGYWLVDGAGTVFAFGDARSFGSLDGGRDDVVGIAALPHGDGYWLATSTGDVQAFGAAPSSGSLGDPSKKIVDITATVSGRGYWLVDREGHVFAFGDASLFSQGKPDLRSGQIVAIVSTPFVNHDPIATADTAVLDEDTTVDIAVLANDTDPDGDPLSVASVTQPSHGVATLGLGGIVRYAPAKDFNGVDAFTYRVVDGVGGGATGTVSLVIRPVNDPPVAVDDAFVTDEDTSLQGSLVANDTDVDGDALGAQLVAAPAHGTLDIGAGGAFTYVPNPDYNGDDSFTYRASDGQLTSDVATARIHVNPVNDPPVAAEDRFGTDEDQPLAVDAPGVLANDHDVDSPTISATIVSQTAHGDIALAADGSFVYTPIANFNGVDTFVYRASDGSLQSGDTTVTIFVAPVNDPPVGNADAYVIDEDTMLTVPAPGLLANDSDVDGDDLQVRLSQPPAHGGVHLTPDGSFDYMPDPNYNGPDGFTYDLTDGNVVVSGIVVTITVNPVDDLPTAADDEYSTQVGTTLTVAAPGVLGNDFNDNGNLTAVLVGDVAHGTLALFADGSFTYTTSLTSAGTDFFTYKATDGTADSDVATVNINVTAGSSGGGGGSFGSFGQPSLMVWDFDTLNLHVTGSIAKTPLGGKVVNGVYIPERGARGHDRFDLGGTHFEIEVLSDIWGD